MSFKKLLFWKAFQCVIVLLLGIIYRGGDIVNLEKPCGESLERLAEITKEPLSFSSPSASKDDMLFYFCSYFPPELAEAFDFSPLRPEGKIGGETVSGKHLQAYICSYAHGICNMMLSENDRIGNPCVFVQSCDTMQRLSDIIRINRNGDHIDLVLPSRIGEVSENYARAELLAAIRSLEKTSGKDYSQKGLLASYEKRKAFRKILTKAYELRKANPDALLPSEWSLLFNSYHKGSANRTMGLAEKIVSCVESERAGRAGAGVFVSGSVLPPQFWRIADETGLRIVGDDSCSGSRNYLDMDIDETDDPLDALLANIISRIPCPCKHAEAVRRTDRTIRLIRESKAAGVIFYLLKYCDPHHFDYPHISNSLKKLGIETLLIQGELGMSSESERTKIETFAEVLKRSAGL